MREIEREGGALVGVRPAGVVAPRKGSSAGEGVSRGRPSRCIVRVAGNKSAEQADPVQSEFSRELARPIPDPRNPEGRFPSQFRLGVELQWELSRLELTIPDSSLFLGSESGIGITTGNTLPVRVF